MTYDPQVAQRNADWGASENVYDLATNLQISGCISQETKNDAKRPPLLHQAENVVEAQLASVAEFGCPQTGPQNGEPNQAFLAAQASLRLVTS